MSLQRTKNSQENRDFRAITDHIFAVMHFQRRKTAEFVQESTHFCLQLPELPLQCLQSAPVHSSALRKLSGRRFRLVSC